MADVTRRVDSPAFYEERIRLQREEIARLRDALDVFADPRHWGITRDLGRPVPTWIGTVRETPTDLARSALAGSYLHG